MTRGAVAGIEIEGPCPLCGRTEPAPRFVRAAAVAIVLLVLGISAAIMIALAVWVVTHV